jgi:hypothetical protein
LRDIALDQGQARQIFAKNPELFLQLAQQENITRDLVAIGYRRKQLQHFHTAWLTSPSARSSPTDWLSSRVRACTSSNSRTFSIAITAWLAKVATS